MIAGLIPLLMAFHPAFLRARVAQVLIVLLLVTKLASSLVLAQQGWCVRLTASVPIVLGAPEKVEVQHGWDARADWWTSVPRCSAIMTAGYPDLTRFPAWFLTVLFQKDRPPHAHVGASIDGFMSPRAAGTLTIATQGAGPMRFTVDGDVVGQTGPVLSVPLARGTHHVQLETAFGGEQWALVPAWNGRDVFREMETTSRFPTRLDHVMWPWLATLTALGVCGLLIGWCASALRRIQPPAVLAAWTLGLSAVCAAAGYLALMTYGRWLALALVGGLFLAVPTRLQTTRGVAALVALPWLALCIGAALGRTGQFTFYTPGDDWHLFQLFAYRIFMQGYWLEGGQPTFWFQPLYRWIAGALHIVFGDSSAGEMMLDAWAIAVGILFAGRVVSRIAGFRWGLAAALATLLTFVLAPTWYILGRGLGEIVSAGCIYLAGLVILEEWPAPLVILTAGVLSIAAFYTRLNNLPFACGAFALAIPLSVPASTLWRPRELWSRLRWRLFAGLAGMIALGILLFAWRTWYYTGVFSVFYGTQRQHLATIKPGAGIWDAVRAIAGSLLVLITVQDPPRWDPRAIFVVGGVLSAVLAAANVRPFRDAPLALVALCLSGLAGALVSRGTAYVGRFSIHLIPVCVAVLFLVAARVAPRLRLVFRREPHVS